MKKLIAFLLIVSAAYAGDYKACTIKFKTDAGLCQQIEKILNHVDTIGAWAESGGDTLAPKNTFKSGYVLKNIREYRGLEIRTTPHWSPDSGYVATGEAVLIYEEIER